MSRMLERFVKGRHGSAAFVVDCLVGVVRNQTVIARVWCACFVVLLVAVPISIVFVPKDALHVGEPLLFAVLVVVVTIVLAVPAGRRRRSGEPDLVRTVTLLAVFHAVVLLAALTASHWNRVDVAGGWRALLWSIVLPGSVDIVVTLLAAIVALDNGPPVYRKGLLDD